MLRKISEEVVKGFVEGFLRDTPEASKKQVLESFKEAIKEGKFIEVSDSTASKYIGQAFDSLGTTLLSESPVKEGSVEDLTSLLKTKKESALKTSTISETEDISLELKDQEHLATYRTIMGDTLLKIKEAELPDEFGTNTGYCRDRIGSEFTGRRLGEIKSEEDSGEAYTPTTVEEPTSKLVPDISIEEEPRGTGTKKKPVKKPTKKPKKTKKPSGKKKKTKKTKTIEHILETPSSEPETPESKDYTLKDFSLKELETTFDRLIANDLVGVYKAIKSISSDNPRNPEELKHKIKKFLYSYLMPGKIDEKNIEKAKKIDRFINGIVNPGLFNAPDIENILNTVFGGRKDEGPGLVSYKSRAIDLRKALGEIDVSDVPRLKDGSVDYLSLIQIHYMRLRPLVKVAQNVDKTGLKGLEGPSLDQLLRDSSDEDKEDYIQNILTRFNAAEIAEKKSEEITQRYQVAQLQAKKQLGEENPEIAETVYVDAPKLAQIYEGIVRFDARKDPTLEARVVKQRITQEMNPIIENYSNIIESSQRGVSTAYQTFMNKINSENPDLVKEGSQEYLGHVETFMDEIVGIDETFSETGEPILGSAQILAGSNKSLNELFSKDKKIAEYLAKLGEA